MDVVKLTISIFDEYGCDLQGSLTFTPPDPTYPDVMIDELEVVNTCRRSGIGTLLVNTLKDLVASSYNKAVIKAYVSPIGRKDEGVSLANLISFYSKNEFEIRSITDKDADVTFTFNHA